MKDVNGIEIKTGDVVEINGAYFKTDNGLYYVRHSAGDPDWCATDHGLQKISKSGKIRTASGTVGFWPIMVTVNDRYKRTDAEIWNREHATIEIRNDINRAQIAEHFAELADGMDSQIEYYKYNFGEESETYIQALKIKEHYKQVAASIS